MFYNFSNSVNIYFCFLIEKIKALLTASKTTDHTVLGLRKLSEKYVKRGCHVRNAAAMSGLKTGLILYLIIRTFTKSHYG